MLIRCGECGEQISDQAEVCPHCGAPVERRARPSDAARPATTTQRAQRMVVFTAVIVLLVDAVLYVGGRVVIAVLARKSSFPSWSDIAFTERILIEFAGTVAMLAVACLLSRATLRALHVRPARPLTRWALTSSISVGIIATLVSAWIVWSASVFSFRVSCLVELRTAWPGQPLLGWNGHPLLVPMSSMPENAWLIPAISAIFLASSLVAGVSRLVYLRLFEKE